MVTPGEESLKRTSLFDSHVSSGGRMVPFAGWEMPVQYSGILDEARAVRSRAGVFDVSHMGRVETRGRGAGAFLGRVLSFDAPGMRRGRGRYGVICDRGGGIIDDCITYRLGAERFLLVPNASNLEAVLRWLARWAPGAGEVQIEDTTPATAMLAVQGPQAVEILGEMAVDDLTAIRPFRCVEAELSGSAALMARTGYTGEDGFELMLTAGAAPEIWERLVERGVTPCGLGARDVLRLEAGLPLHGNDIDLSTNPEEAGLGRFVDPDREGYVAGEALRRIRCAGQSRLLVGFFMVGRGIARHGYAILDGSEKIGHVTSGSYSPTLDRNIGLGYVPDRVSTPGSRFQIDVRGRMVEAEVTTLPFYSRRRT